MDWDDVRHFLALARTGSIRAAGAALGLSHSTVARRVEALEARLGTRLFDRSRSGFVLTQAGRHMLGSAERIEQEVAALERALVGRDERLVGPVSLTCSDSYISRLLLPSLHELCAQQPGIELSCNIDSRSFDLAKREADIALRALDLTAEPPAFLIGQRLLPIVLANYVAIAHAERLDPEQVGSATRWASFEDRALQDSMTTSSSYPEVSAWGGFATIELLVQAGLEGFGLVILPTYVGDQVPGLRRLGQPDLRHLGYFWLLSHADLRDNARIRTVKQRVSDVLKRHGRLFRGEP